MSLYEGVLNGSVQSSVVDQNATALPGQLYSVTDMNMVDNESVGETLGVGVAIGVKSTYVTSPRPGINNKSIFLPTSAATDADFQGIIVRSQAIRSDANGVPIVRKGQMASILRRRRAGGRIWVNANNSVTTAGAACYWIVQDTSGHGFPIGSFSFTALGAAGIDTVALTNVVFASLASAGQPVLIEMGA